MEIYSKGFAKAFTMALGSCILLIPSKSQAQLDTLNLDQRTIDLWNKNYPRINAVLYSQVDNQRMAYQMRGEINAVIFLGKSVRLPDKYKLATREKPQIYLEDELVEIEKANPYDFGQLDYVIYKNPDNYFLALPEEDVSKLEKILMTEYLIKKVRKLGYKEYDDGYGEYYIKSKTAEIKLDAGLYDALKSNPNYISQYDAAKIKINALITQSVPHSKTLDKYISQYRIQRSRMSTANLNAWRTATTNAQKLLNQINKLEEPFEGNYSFRQLDDSKRRILDNFLDDLLASKGILGM